jgi:Helix-turn-helix domain
VLVSGWLADPHAVVTRAEVSVVTHENVHTATELLTLTETAAVLRTPVATLRYWRHLGVGPDGFRLGHRVVYRRQDVERWVTERQQAQSPRR